MPLPALPGQRLARGVARLLVGLGHAVLCEFVPVRGLRVDLISIGPKGEIWIVECKSSRADLRADRKWQGYLGWCDRYFWAVDVDFPLGLLPEEGGLILADPYGAEIARMAPETRLAAPRRARLTRDIARVASLRLQGLADPGLVSGAAP
ncbi:MmcB family DNA repair protein [Paracoccus spongiarum]|uniref:MmcB family DNA repair protein n=1 Tax=Paracoccus spongiarum TaxID=3064387 RepID=A0ABT9JG81_9RHOB|nr:MmcB family DNA repair protein [Paracoccus sp. 2205BS29-5]MDP5308071.1 MmcB family DNA repair protein [Paracoccus sp. 2205BS29-5]